ncbi:unnamed protein product, partial [marine sediment metagenome]
GKAAMDLQWHNAAPTASDPSKSKIVGKFDFAVIPGKLQPDGSIKRTPTFGGWSLEIPKDSKNKEAAWEFMVWATSPEIQPRLAYGQPGDLNDYGEVDVIIVGRGGGSFEDLFSFNERIVAEAIYDSRIPIVSAVGHEIDVTISDFVADKRAPTPSAAAELIIPKKKDLLESLTGQQQRVSYLINNYLDIARADLDKIKSSPAFRQPYRTIEDLRQEMD